MSNNKTVVKTDSKAKKANTNKPKVEKKDSSECELINNVFQIAIDGPSASGKGTNARLLARKFGFVCIDTGALYRGVTMHFMEKNVDIEDDAQVEKALKSMKMGFEFVDGDTHVFLGDKDVTERLHDVDVCAQVYYVAQLQKVRERVRKIQHETAAKGPTVIEGRDITSVVFPDALFKFYITATLKERARRRYMQEVKKGNATVTLSQIRNMIYGRDKADLEREHSPMVKVKDAFVIDCTRRSPDQVVRMMEKIITKTLA